jgi:hypothetical protein
MVMTLDTKDVLRTPAIPGQPVTDPAGWKGSDLEGDQRWVFNIDQQDLSQILSMARSVRRTIGDNPNGLLTLPERAFEFGAYSRKLQAIRHELKDGLGAVLIRGLPLDEIDLLDAATIYWGIGRHLGVACSNNPEGDMLGHVTDLGKTQKDPNSRGYQTREEMAFHCDQSTIVGLLCVRTPKSGGVSKISSSVTLYNEMLKRSPESAAVLSQPFCWTKHGEMNKGETAYYESPVFNFLDDKLCTSFGPTHMRKGHALPETPDLTDAQEHAIALAKSIAEEQHYGMQLQRGDMQFLNNSVVLHTRNEYEDWPNPAQKRLLWRLWLIAPDIRPLTPYIKQWGVGIKLASTTERIVL